MTTFDQSERWIRLDMLPMRVCAVVRSLSTEDEETHRLKTLGICVGRNLEVVRTGDPLIVKIFGSRLGLSAKLAMRVKVEACEPAHCVMSKEN